MFENPPWDSALIFLLVLLGGRMAVLRALKGRKDDEPRGIQDRKDPEDTCTACQSADLRFEPGACIYQCMTCGYEGGPGMQEQFEQQSRARFAEQSLTARWRDYWSLLADIHTDVDAAIASERSIGAGLDLETPGNAIPLWVRARKGARRILTHF